MGRDDEWRIITTRVTAEEVARWFAAQNSFEQVKFINLLFQNLESELGEVKAQSQILYMGHDMWSREHPLFADFVAHYRRDKYK